MHEEEGSTIVLVVDLGSEQRSTDGESCSSLFRNAIR